MPGAAGGAILFFMFLIGAVIVGLYTFAYSAHIFLSDIEATAAGNDEIIWPDEPYFDWLWKAVYLAWFITVWLVPLLIAGHWLPSGQFVYFAVGLFWLIFPISMLSSMSASSRWFVFSAHLLPRLVRHFGSLVAFYLLTAPVLALASAIVYFWWLTGHFLLLLAAALATAIGLLIYARFLGRLALIIRHGDEGDDSEAPARAERPRVAVQVQAAAYDPVRTGKKRIRQPSELPPTDAKDPDARTGYNLNLDDDGPSTGTPPGHGWVVRDPPAPYAIADGPAHIAPPRGPMPDRVVKPSEYELKLARSVEDKLPEFPEHPWFAGTWSFPFRRANVSILLTLALGYFVFGGLLTMMASFRPA